MKEVPLTGKKGDGKFALIDDEDYELVNKYNWFFKSDGYVATNIKINGKWKQILLHRYLLNETNPTRKVDHKNHNRLDNQRNNIRIATSQQNMRNRKPSKNKSSKYHGVHKDRDNGRWRVRIKKDRLQTIGLFDDEMDAAHAYDFYALKLFGEFACLNFPLFDYSNYEVKIVPKRPKTSKYIGVGYKKEYQRWYAILKHKHLGYCDSEEDAARNYDYWSLWIGEEKANFPNEDYTNFIPIRDMTRVHHIFAK